MKLTIHTIKKSLFLAGLSLTSLTISGCSIAKEVPVIEENVEEDVEEKNAYGFSSISDRGKRAGVHYIGFLYEIFDIVGNPTTGIVKFAPKDSFSVIQTEEEIYIIKEYDQNKNISTYYDYLRDRAVPNDISIDHVTSLEEYIEEHSDLFSTSLLDQYANFDLYQVKTLLGEERRSLIDLSCDEGRKYIQVSRTSSTQNDTAIISYAPVDCLSIVSGNGMSYLVEDYDSGNTIRKQYDLLRGNTVPMGDGYQVDLFSDYVLSHRDSFDSSLVQFLEQTDISSNYCFSASQFMKDFEKSQETSKQLVK